MKVQLHSLAGAQTTTVLFQDIGSKWLCVAIHHWIWIRVSVTRMPVKYFSSEIVNTSSYRALRRARHTVYQKPGIMRMAAALVPSVKEET